MTNRSRSLADRWCIHILSVSILLCIVTHEHISAQQIGDPDFTPQVGAPAWEEGTGPVVLIDAAHHNFHTADGRYQPFAELLRSDGYIVKSLTDQLTGGVLQSADVLVIANALHSSNAEKCELPTPAALSDSEYAPLLAWIYGGGSLLLIADHMPFPGAVETLVDQFGIYTGNGFVLNESGSGTLNFQRHSGTLVSHPITQGRNESETVEQVFSFTGQAFRLAPDSPAQPLMVLEHGTTLLLPSVAWEFSDKTPQLGAGGMLQGAVLQFGEGRVAFFGEAAMFTAQLAGPEKQQIGMNSPEAVQNAQFALNVMHWLSRLLPPE